MLCFSEDKTDWKGMLVFGPFSKVISLKVQKYSGGKKARPFLQLS